MATDRPLSTSVLVFQRIRVGRPDFQCLLYQKVDLPPIQDRKHPLIIGNETSIVGGIRADQEVEEHALENDRKDSFPVEQIPAWREEELDSLPLSRQSNASHWVLLTLAWVAVVQETAHSGFVVAEIDHTQRLRSSHPPE